MARDTHLDDCTKLGEPEGQLVQFEPIVKDPNKKEDPEIKRKRLEDALAILTNEPPYRCPDCMHESFEPIDLLTHLGEDHFMRAESDEESFAPNKSNSIFSKNFEF